MNQEYTNDRTLQAFAEHDERHEPGPIADEIWIGDRRVSEDEFLREVERRDDQRRAHVTTHYRAASRVARVVRRTRAGRAPRRVGRVVRAVVRVDADSGDGPPPRRSCISKCGAS